VIDRALLRADQHPIMLYQGYPPMTHPPAGWLQRMALQTKLLLMLITINLLTVLVYTGYAAYARQQDEIRRLDSILETASHAVPGLLAAGMLDRERTPDAISRQEYREQSQRLRQYADQTGLRICTCWT